MWKRVGRIATAALLAPWATVPAVGVHVVISGLLWIHESWEMPLNFTPFAVYGMLIAYPVTIVWGIPLHLLLSHFHVGYIWMHALVGAVVALIMGATFFDLLSIEPWQLSLTYASLLALPGIMVAGTFGAIAGQPAPARHVEEVPRPVV